MSDLENRTLADLAGRLWDVALQWHYALACWHLAQARDYMTEADAIFEEFVRRDGIDKAQAAREEGRS